MAGIPTSEYYYSLRRPTEDDRYAAIYQDYDVLKVGTVACFYRPIIILDFTNLFEYN